MALPGERLADGDGQPLFPLLQINVAELPFVPNALEGCKLLVLFMNAETYPFDKAHGQGWRIREYGDLSGLEPIPDSVNRLDVKPFPIRWRRIEDDTPGWEDCGGLVDMSPVNDDPEATDAFFGRFNRYSETKIGGYPCDIQHGVGIDDFVFQVGSEEKAQWSWADSGIAYFFRDRDGEWRWTFQCY